jgi:hypothetical protein
MAASKSNDKVEKQVAENLEQEVEDGFRGTKVDPTPNENYTLKGVTSGKPTPETDDKQAEKARQAQADVVKKAQGEE